MTVSTTIVQAIYGFASLSSLVIVTIVWRHR